jgi:hypothetical protein
MGTHAPATWFLSRRLFLAGIAATYLAAFASLGVQVLGLFGAQGIAPLGATLEALGLELTGWERLRVPTLFWLGSSDLLLRAGCAAGLLASALALAGFVPRAALLAAWVLYLSFTAAGSPFLSFQWDVLLLEAGLLAVLFAPGGLRPFGRGEGEPSSLVHALILALLFKLMVLSGAVKLTSGDDSWKDGSALDFHYWTQPLPHRLSIAAAEAPAWFQRASVLVMFVIELGLPWLLLVPFFRRRLRQVVAAGVAFLMAAVFLTGNYGFFNALTLVLCIPLLDDRAWSVLFRGWKAPTAVAPRPLPGRLLLGALAAPLGLLSCSKFLVGMGWIERPPAPLARLEGALEPLHSVNAYGLFRVMTRERLEIRIEGSDDGQAWRAYPFRYKPEEPERGPVFAGLHMPRLDWQLWFAAFQHGSRYRDRWFGDLLQRLLAGSPHVLALFREDPFPAAPPRFVRATIAPYRFASPAERERGVFWQVGARELYAPVQTLERR